MLSNEIETPYPVKKFTVVNPFRDYFVVRKQPNNYKAMNIGEIKIDSDTTEMFISYLDTHNIVRFNKDKTHEQHFNELLKDYDIIMITDEDTYAAGGGHDQNVNQKIRRNLIDNLFQIVENRLANR